MLGKGRVWDKIEENVLYRMMTMSVMKHPCRTFPPLASSRLLHFLLRGDGDHFLIVQVVLEAGEHEGGHVGAVGAVEVGARLDYEVLRHRHWQTCKRPHTIIPQGGPVSLLFRLEAY